MSHTEPTFVQTTGFDAVRPDLPFVERQALTAIIKHWGEDKYLGLKWREVDWETFLTGGIEEGQTPEEAVVAEIQEETGYLHPKVIKKLGVVHAKFYHVPKKQNRFAHFSVFYVQLEDGESREVAQDEQSKHEVVWLSKEEMESFKLPEGHRFSWNELKPHIS